MKRLVRVKDLVVPLLALTFLSSMVVSCSPASITEVPRSNEQSSTLPSEGFEKTYGISVATNSLCSDGVKTTLILQTDLDAKFWQLRENDFYPQGKTYFETSIIFLENQELYSTSSSGKRDDSIFDPQNHRVSTVQTFFFPKPPLPNSEFFVRAKVFVHDLPPAYSPPVGVKFTEPGIIEVPIEYVLSPTLKECP